MHTRRGVPLRTTVALTLSIALGLILTGLALLSTGAFTGRANAISGPATLQSSVEGMVVDDVGSFTGATVRVRATDNFTFTDSDGRFALSSLIEGEPVEITAWADGYYVASTPVTPTVSGVTLTLRAYHTVDHPDYVWTSPISGNSAGACGNCHPMIMPQWITNAHGSAVTNPRFFSLYNGSDVSGTRQVGPGYVNDFPGTAGNCANCHAPGAGVDGYLTTNMNDARDVITSGIHCDYCHKVGGIYIDPASDSVFGNVPGAQSQRMLRPPAGDNIFFGPFDDIHDPDTYLPIISESAFCAPCHQFSMWGTPIYESYEEWLVSPYAEAGVTCQDCHMPPTGDTFFARPEVGGLPHPPDRIPSHLQRGANDVELLQNTVTLGMSAQQTANRTRVTVIVTNTDAGHHVPTDFPGRQMILTVTARDAQGQDLPLVSGPTIPGWGGAQAGQPGKAFAKVLRDIESGAAPVVSYWKQTLIQSDNRIPALASDSTAYVFGVAPAGGLVTVTAELRFRRAFQAVMDEKGWSTPDIIMEHVQLELPTTSWWGNYLPVLVRSFP